MKQEKKRQDNFSGVDFDLDIVEKELEAMGKEFGFDENMKRERYNKLKYFKEIIKGKTCAEKIGTFLGYFKYEIGVALICILLLFIAWTVVKIAS